MTRKQFAAKCKEIVASDLTLLEKREAIHRAATFLIEHTWNRIPEARDLLSRIEAVEKKHAGRGGYSYCPHDGEWTPEPPPAIKALDREWIGLRHQKINEIYSKVIKKELAKMDAQARA